MGQRTQIGINVKFVSGNGTEYIERGVYHYQWGGYHPGMFENLIGLFINTKNYVLKARKDNFYMNEFERKFAYRNWLKMDFVDMLSSEKNHLVNEEIKDYDQFKGKTINTVTEKEYYDFLLNYQDCNDGRIAVDILLDGKNIKENIIFEGQDGTAITFNIETGIPQYFSSNNTINLGLLDFCEKIFLKYVSNGKRRNNPQIERMEVFL